MQFNEPAHNPGNVIDAAAAADGPARERMWPAMGALRHIIVTAAIVLLTIIANINTLTQRYVIMDRSGFTLDSRYIIELDPRSRALQWEDRSEIQQTLFTETAVAAQAWAMYQKPADFESFAARAKALGDGAQVSEWGLRNYFKQDYWWPKGISGLYRPLTSISYWWNFAPIRNVAPNDWDKLRETQPEEHRRIAAKALVRFHWTNTILHGICAVLVYFLMLALCQRFWVSVFAAALFSTHPITVESVANIIGRADIFAAISVFSTLLVYIRSTKVRGAWRLPWLFLGCLITVIGAHCKESAVAVLPCVAAYEMIYRYRPRISGLFDGVHSRFDDLTRWIGDFIGAALRFAFCGWIFLVPAVVVWWLTREAVFAESTPPEEPFLDNPIRGNPYTGLNENPVLNLVEGRVTAFKVIVLLTAKLVFPLRLSADYSFNQIRVFDSSFSTHADYLTLLAALLVPAAFVAGLLLWKRGHRAAAFMIAFYLLALLPTANVVKVIGSIMAERFMYLPLFGFVGGVSLAVFWAAEKLLALRSARSGPVGHSPSSAGMIRPSGLTASSAMLSFTPHIILGVVIVLFTARTLHRNYAWQSDEKLWESAIEVSPNAFRCYQSYAFALYENAQIDKMRGRIDHDEYRKRVLRMIELDEKGLQIVDVLPHEMNSARMYLHLGMYYAEMGRSSIDPASPERLTPEAREWFEKSVAILNRAVPIDRAFSKLNRRKEIIRLKPMNEIPEAGLAPIYLILGESQLRLSRWDDAIETFRYLQMLDPSSPTSYIQIGMARLNQSKIDDALTSLLQAVILDPTRPEPWPLLQNIYQVTGQPGAIRLSPGANAVDASSPMVQQHVRTAMRDLVRIMVKARQIEFARQLRRQAIDIHRVTPGVIDLFFEEAGVPAEPEPTPQKQWR
ncbi:MAG TPA: hypothetical protein PLD59_13590 [Tepidisphaeraceae bacterium]|nr:hypothetical protein [Tepidisphaeraceae bacterium]